MDNGVVIPEWTGRLAGPPLDAEGERARLRRAENIARRAARDQKIRPARHVALGRLRDAERDRDWALDEVGTAAAGLLLDEKTEADVIEAERTLLDAEHAVRRWTLAAARLDEESGVVRDSTGRAL